MLRQEKHYAAIAPMMTIAGIFLHPIASTVIPMLFFFLFYWRRMSFAQLIALRAADLAFTIQIILFLERFALWLYLDNVTTTQEQAQAFQFNFLIFVILLLLISLTIGTIQTFRGKSIKYYISFGIAERVFNAVSKKNKPS